MVQNELAIPTDQQELRFNGNVLSPMATVASSGLSDGDLLLVSRKQAMRSAPPPNPQGALLDALRTDPAAMERLRALNPGLAAGLREGRPDAERAVAEAMGQFSIPPGAEGGNPMSQGAQKAIEERIRMENVAQNLEAAMEHNPESFGSVVMLFVDCKVNSVSGVKAFVDRYVTLWRCTVLVTAARLFSIPDI